MAIIINRNHNYYELFRIIIIVLTIMTMTIILPISVKVSKGSKGKPKPAFGNSPVSYVPSTELVLKIL